MKAEITSKRLKECYRVYYVDSRDAGGKILGKYPIFYNAGIYGWNYDVYDFGRIAIITGYRCPKCERLDDKKMKKLYKRFSELKRESARQRLIDNFLDNINDFL